MTSRITGATSVAGVVGAPVGHSLSPLIHNAWLDGAGIDGVYVAFAPFPDRFAAFVEGCRGGVIAGLNVTIPFKEEALALADDASPLALAAGAANLLLFHGSGRIEARNTDGDGMLGALAAQAEGFDPRSGPAVILGAGGAARGAAAALLEAGCPEVRLVNRTLHRAEKIAAALGERVRPCGWPDHETTFADATLLVNATALGLAGGEPLDITPHGLSQGAVVLDMVYRPLPTPFLNRARAAGHRTVDGLEMLIRQAAPSFEAFFGQPPPARTDVRALALAVLEPGG